MQIVANIHTLYFQIMLLALSIILLLQGVATEENNSTINIISLALGVFVWYTYGKYKRTPNLRIGITFQPPEEENDDQQ